MEKLENLQRTIEEELEDYKNEKLENEDIDYHAQTQIDHAINHCISDIWELLKELDYDIEQWIQLSHEPSDYEHDIRDDERARYSDIRGE